MKRALVQFSKRGILVGAIAVAALAMSAPRAEASTITFTLNQGGPSAGPFGFVDVSQTAAQQLAGVVNVLVTLEPGVVFATTGGGNHPTFAFNFGLALVSANINLIEDGGNGDWTWGLTAGGPVSGGGDFGYFFLCTNCNNGTSPPTNPGPLQFTISKAGITPASFIGNANDPSYYFAADLGVPSATSDSGFWTGMVFAGIGRETRGCDEDCGTAVPEPASLLLLGTGLALAAFGLRRQAKKS